MKIFSVYVFGRCLVEMEDESKAQRYAQAIREGMWQCNITQEPWRNGAFYKDHENPQGHTCDENCCDSRTDDEVEVRPESVNNLVTQF